MATVQTPKRGEVWLIDFDPAVGAEMRNHRPAVVMSLDQIGRLPLRIVVPITDWKPHYPNYPWFTHLIPNAKNGLIKESGADAFQLKSVSFDRFVRQIGVLQDAELNNVAAASSICVDAP